VLFVLGESMAEIDKPLLGRIKIFTSEKEITEKNIINILQRCLSEHERNSERIQALIDYEGGLQPLKRKKTVRPEINIVSNDNLANYVKEFKIGYFWGTPVMLVQRGNEEHHNTDTAVDDKGISALNEALVNGNCIGREDMQLAEFVEICGIGHRLVEIKTDYETEDGSPSTYFELYTLDSRYAFCVYHNGPGQKKILGVTYSKDDNGVYSYTCYTNKRRFDIKGGKVLKDEPNLLGMIPIVEYERAVDRTGCFERQMSLMDSLNILISDFSNDSSQKTQELWWGNDIDLPKNEQGEVIKPKSGQWVLTYTGGNGNNPRIQPMSSAYDGTSSLNAIATMRSTILQNCKVPIQYTSEGGGSTGVATDAMTGWSATEVDALREEQMISKGKREELQLILRAIKFAPSKELSEDDPLRKIHSSDIDFHFNRRKNYDMAVKANAFATWVSHGINGRHALKTVDAFPDVEQVWLDSKEGIEKYQDSTYGENNEGAEGTDERIMSDNSDQAGNSPLIDGMNTDASSIAV
jgi:SPP1 family phage portal protein